jgi:hypothetical protein
LILQDEMMLNLKRISLLFVYKQVITCSKIGLQSFQTVKQFVVFSDLSAPSPPQSGKAEKRISGAEETCTFPVLI